MVRYRASQDTFTAFADELSEMFRQEFIGFVKETVDEGVKAGKYSPRYTRWVNGVANAPLEEEVLPNPIVYNFLLWEDIIPKALAYAKSISPRQSGAYSESWRVLINGEFKTEFNDIPRDAKIWIVNDQPYHRKLDSGHSKIAPRHFIERIRQHVFSEYRDFVEAEFGAVVLTGEMIHPQPREKRKALPYILHGHLRKGVRKYSRTTHRADTEKDALMRYPALIMSAAVR